MRQNEQYEEEDVVSLLIKCPVPTCMICFWQGEFEISGSDGRRIIH
jgi:hypothetical protein